jgi:RNase P subunit RPR2
MSRLRCKKCGSIFEQGLSATVFLSPHVGPYRMLKCPACGKTSFFNVHSSVKDPVTWPSQQKKSEQPTESQAAEKELRRRIEESKYERT